MAAKATVFSNDLLALIFNATAIADLAENDSSSPATNLYVSLHTASPGAGGNQSTNEISYTGYARVAVARTSGGWTVSGGGLVPAAAITFGAMTAGAGGTVTHFAVGTGSSGTGKLLYFGTVTPNLVVAVGTTPQLTTATAISES